MSGEIQGHMQSLQDLVVKLQGLVELHRAILRESMVSALCTEKKFYHRIPRIYVAKEIKYF